MAPSPRIAKYVVPLAIEHCNSGRTEQNLHWSCRHHHRSVGSTGGGTALEPGTHLVRACIDLQPAAALVFPLTVIPTPLPGVNV